MSYTAIASQTLTSSASSVTFSSIPGTFRDLVLVCGNIITNSNAVLGLQFNGVSSGSLYSWVYADATTGAGVQSEASTGDDIRINRNWNPTSTGPSQFNISVMDYTQTNKHKSVLSRGGRADTGTVMLAGRFASTSAITSLTVANLGAATFSAGCTFSLYGVSA